MPLLINAICRENRGRAEPVRNAVRAFRVVPFAEVRKLLRAHGPHAAGCLGRGHEDEVHGGDLPVNGGVPRDLRVADEHDLVAERLHLELDRVHAVELHASSSRAPSRK